MIVADRGESGIGWAAIDDFEFLYDVFQVGIVLSFIWNGKMVVWFGFWTVFGCASFSLIEKASW